MSSTTKENIKRWATSMEDLIHDPIGLQEFMKYLEKEYCLENIRFWLAVKDFKEISDSEITQKSQEIYDEFLAPGALFEINIDGKTKEKTQKEMRNPSKSMFDDAAEHVYMLLLKKDCYPRFIRSDHYRNLLAKGDQLLMKRNFFGSVGHCNKTERNERRRITGSSLCMHSLSSSILQLHNQSSLYSSAKSRIGFGSRPNSPRDFLLNLDTSSLYRSQSNHNVKDNSTVTVKRTVSSALTPVLDDVCPWDSLGYHSDTKLMPEPAGREQRRGLRSSLSSLLFQTRATSSTLPHESAGSSDESCTCSLASHFRHTCCMGDARRRNRRRRHRVRKNAKPSSDHQPRIRGHDSSSPTSLFTMKKYLHHRVPASSSSTSLQETAAVAKPNRMKRFFSMSSLAKKQLNATSNPVINVSPAEDDGRVHGSSKTSTIEKKTAANM